MQRWHMGKNKKIKFTFSIKGTISCLNVHKLCKVVTTQSVLCCHLMYFLIPRLFLFSKLVWTAGVPVGLALRRLTGNNISGHYKRQPFLFFFFFSPSYTFLIEGVLGSKNLFSKSWWERQKRYKSTPFQTLSAILGPPSCQFGILQSLQAPGITRLVLLIQNCVYFWGCFPPKNLNTKSLIGIRFGLTSWDSYTYY